MLLYYLYLIFLKYFKKGTQKMDNETREVLVTFLQGREYLFSLFHRLLGAEPEKELFDAVSSESSLQTVLLFDSEDSNAAKELYKVLQSCHFTEPEYIQQIKDEYTRLFIGPDRLSAAPWESVYTTKERALFQESTLGARSWYRKYHYLPEKYPRVADDHISLMMHFLSLTSTKAAACLEGDDLNQCWNILADQKKFETEHLLNWIFLYAEDIQTSKTRKFYPQLVKATADFIKYDNQIIDELMDNLKL